MRSAVDLQISQEKKEMVDETLELLNKYEVIAAADLYKVGSEMLHGMRRQLKEQLAVKVIKNTLMRLSMEEAKKEAYEKFMEDIVGPNVFLFTNGNPFKLAMTLDANKVKVFAKTGDKALNNIIIKAGNTGLSPGPIISKFGALGVRTRIEAGNIWVNQDVTVVKTGDIISQDLAELLMRLGIKAAEMGLRIKAVYERGEIIPGDHLILDIEDYRRQLEAANRDALNLAIQSRYVTPDTVPLLLSKAAQEAIAVAVEANYITQETVQIILQKADAQARNLAVLVGVT